MYKTKAFKKEYRKVLDHRKGCGKWGKEFCLDCFGGGLSSFSAKVGEQL